MEHDMKECPPRLSHGAREETSIAKSEGQSLRIRFPVAYYKEVAAIIKEVGELLGCELGTMNYPFPNFAIKDALSSREAGIPKKDGKNCTSRILLRILSIGNDQDPGLTHPAEVSKHLWETYGANYVASGFKTELVTLSGGGPSNGLHLYGTGGCDRPNLHH